MPAFHFCDTQVLAFVSTDLRIWCVMVSLQLCFLRMETAEIRRCSSDAARGPRPAFETATVRPQKSEQHSESVHSLLYTPIPCCSLQGRTPIPSHSQRSFQNPTVETQCFTERGHSERPTFSFKQFASTILPSPNTGELNTQMS